MFFPPWFPEKQGLWFVEFMQQALYHPQYGYYQRLASPIGAQGDFITAPELTPLFGETLAQVCARVGGDILEFGAGSGKLCLDILTALEKMQALPERYYILEVSASLKNQQMTRLKAALPHLLDRIIWLSTLPDFEITGVMIANEVLDAMPVHRFQVSNQGFLESKILYDKAKGLYEVFEPCLHARLLKHLEQHCPPLRAPYLSEVNGLLENWIQQCARVLKKGMFLVIDYGFPAAEYYHPDRNTGTLMCHYQHQAHLNPLIHVGEQDITAHVDFTHVAYAADKAGFEVSYYASQAAFLLSQGLLDALAMIDSPVARFEANQAVMKLVSPHEMGELFKVMVLTKNTTVPWDLVQDRRGHL